MTTSQVLGFRDRAAIRSWMGLFIALFLGGGCDRRIGVDVSIENANTMTDSYIVSISYGPEWAVQTSEQRVPRSSDRIWIWLPPESEGVARIVVRALTAKGCSAGVGTAQSLLTEQHVPMVVSMTDTDRIACPVKVLRVGGADSRVTSLPLGIDCGDICDQYFSAPLKLTARPGRYSPFVSFDGCDSTLSSECDISDVSQPRTVTAVFKDLCASKGTCQEQVPVTSNLVSILGRSNNDIWAVGEGGATVHFDGTKWTAVASGKNCVLRALWQSNTQLWAVGSAGCVLVRPLDDTTVSWTDKSLVIGTDLFAVAGTADESMVWIGGGSLLGTTNRGASWRSASPSVPGVTGIVSMSKPPFRVLSSNGYFHDYDLDSDTWTRHANGYAGTPVGLVSRSSSELWSITTSGLLSASGSVLMPSNCSIDEVLSGRTLRSLWSASGQLVWVVGSNGLLVSCLPSGGVPASTYPVSTDLRRNLSGIWGNPGDAIYAVGDGGLILRLPSQYIPPL